ncbi:unknown similar to AMEV238 [Mythimna separata entomopoxvirus 'L']|uniref:Uncharacterized protein n=1 Tax=Mythimna separata entomopoxvirus 'L' TaxID=1293572 RepID=A0A916KQI5_9POXV|nr:unknown similar to AMEV238 [Mythimna separata entomopoxvirus 'L']CCU56463.1 unknown similar to AMEV238 [Mythimna separata entomopoxvirus 'L']
MITLFIILIIVILICLLLFIEYYNSDYTNNVKKHKNYNINNIYYINLFDRYNSIIMELLDNRVINILKFDTDYTDNDKMMLHQTYNSKCSIFYLDTSIKKYENDKYIILNINNYNIISDIFKYIKEYIITKKLIIDDKIFKQYTSLKNIISNYFILIPDVYKYDSNYPYLCYYTLTTMSMLMFDNASLLIKNVDYNTYNDIILTSRIIKYMTIKVDIEYFNYICINSNILFIDNSINLIRRTDFLCYKNSNIVILYEKILLYKNISIVADYIDDDCYFGNYIFINKHYTDIITKIDNVGKYIGCFNINNKKNIKYLITIKQNKYQKNILLYNNYLLKHENNNIYIVNDIIICKNKYNNKINSDNNTINYYIIKNIDTRIISDFSVIKIDNNNINHEKLLNNKESYNCFKIEIYDKIYGNISYEFNQKINIILNKYISNNFKYYELNIINPNNIFIKYNF